MNISVFLSYPKPHLKSQKDFVNKLREYLEQRGLQPRTLGVTDYDMEAPLTAIRRLMLEENIPYVIYGFDIYNIEISRSGSLYSYR